MQICCKLIAFGLAAIALSAARGGVPTEWQVRIGPKATVYQAERYHGDALDLRATLTSGGLPLVYQGAARLYAQTNGMGALWWDLAPVTVASNVLAATWRPEFDTGADVVDVFLGAPSNFQAHARIRFLPSPGPAPNSLPMPTPVLDFSAVDLVNVAALTNGWSFGSSADLTDATNYTDRALGAFVSTGTVARALSYGTPTHWTDATGCVWEVVSSDWALNPAAFEGRPIKLVFEYGGWAPYWLDGVQAGQTKGTLDSTNLTWTASEAAEALIATRRTAIPYTNYVGRVALTNDVSDAISTNNEAFVSAVLAAPLVGASQSDLAELSEYGTYGTVGAALLALIAGLAALKRRVGAAETALAQKASLADLPYAMVTPGEWEFSGDLTGFTDLSVDYDSARGEWFLSYERDGFPGQSDGVSGDGNELSVTFSHAVERWYITATRPSLPGHLCARANNLIDAQTGNVTLTLPPFVAGKVRDLLVACTIGVDGNDEPWSVIFQGADGEEISFKAEGDDASTATFPVPDAAGDWWYSLTERAPHVFAVSLKQLQDVSQPTQGGS